MPSKLQKVVCRKKKYAKSFVYSIHSLHRPSQCESIAIHKTVTYGCTKGICSNFIILASLVEE